MEEVIFLFLYHKTDAVTQRHFQLLGQLHSRAQVVPLGYQLSVPERLPGTVDVALDWDYGWPIRSVWHESDKIYMRWFLSPKRPKARRYIFFEYDIWPNAAADAFYGDAWNSEVAATSIKTPESDPAWLWWAHAPRLKFAFPLRQGISPLAGVLWSHEALDRLSQSRQFQDCYCELRLGTLAKLLGLKCTAIPQAHRTISWRPQDIQVSSQPAWYHPVKQLI